MAQKMLQDLFYDTLKDIYYAERQILKALPKMARAAQSEKLRMAFEPHRVCRRPFGLSYAAMAGSSSMA